MVGVVKPRKKRSGGTKTLSFVPLSRVLPSIITLMSLCVGFCAVKFALVGKWQTAVACTLGATLLDAADGRIARLLNSSSQFGAELDSLSDFVVFGASPALVVYLFSINSLGAYGWAVSLFFLVCSILRLARFNIQALKPLDNYWEKQFFTGVPITFAAVIALMPLILYIKSGAGVFRSSYFCSAILLFAGCLMISRFKTFSFKTIKISQKFVLPFMLVMGLFITLLVTDLWSTMIFVVCVYLFSIPFSVRRYKKLLITSDKASEE